jgi:hypothetical protein
MLQVVPLQIPYRWKRQEESVMAISVLVNPANPLVSREAKFDRFPASTALVDLTLEIARKRALIVEGMRQALLNGDQDLVTRQAEQLCAQKLAAEKPQLAGKKKVCMGVSIPLG